MSNVPLSSSICVASFNQMETLNSVQTQGGNPTTISLFSSAILVGEGDQQKFKGVNPWVPGMLGEVFMDALITELPL